MHEMIADMKNLIKINDWCAAAPRALYLMRRAIPLQYAAAAGALDVVVIAAAAAAAAASERRRHKRNCWCNLCDR